MEHDLKKIDFLVPMGGVGGVETVVNKTAVYLLELGYQIRVVQWTFDGYLWLDPKLPFFPLLHRQRLDTIYDAVPLYTSFIRQQGMPDMIIATPWPYVSVVAKEAVREAGGDCRVISWLHGPLEKYAQYGAGGYGSLSYADVHFVLNHAEEERLRVNLPEAKVAVVHNPVDFSGCVWRDCQPKLLDTLLFVGRLSKEKRVHLILEGIAGASHPWKLRIVGDGNEREKLQDLASSLGISERVDFLGWQEHPWEYADGVAALILASEYEGAPLAVFEALACGIPVISPPLELCVELIRPGVNGFLYSSDMGLALPEILDLYGNRSFPEILPENCRASVMDYEEKKALEDFHLRIRQAWDGCQSSREG